MSFHNSIFGVLALSLLLVSAGCNGEAGEPDRAVPTLVAPGSAIPTTGTPASRPPAANVSAPGAAATAVMPARPSTRDLIPDVAERVVKSVVNISTTRPLARGGRLGGGNPFFRGSPDPRRGGPAEKGLGSGVIVSSDGLIVTNNHVIEKATAVKVALTDGREFAAKIVGTDPASDLAVLKLTGKVSGLVPLKFGSSRALRLGETVLAVGNPFGVGQTVTMGIVSAFGRADVGIVDYENFIQTDAAINPGNSGGALVNLRGELVGVNTAILSRTGGYQGIGFAIPSDMVEPIMKSLSSKGRVVRGWLGVGIDTLSRARAASMNLGDLQGVLVTALEPGSPAAKAGLREGDVILTVNGDSTLTTGELRNAIAIAGADAKIDVVIQRGNDRKRLDVVLGEKTASSSRNMIDALRGGRAAPANVDVGGMELAPLSPQYRRALGLAPAVDGVVISAIQSNTPADRANLQPGDVITKINGRNVTSIDAVRRAYASARARVAVSVVRGTSEIDLLIVK